MVEGARGVIAPGWGEGGLVNHVQCKNIMSNDQICKLATAGVQHSCKDASKNSLCPFNWPTLSAGSHRRLKTPAHLSSRRLYS